MKKLLPLLFALLLLAGCVEYNEELWLNPDGSGRAKLRLVHRSNYANTQEIMRKAELPGIHLIDSQVAKSGHNMVYSVTFKFDSIEAFNNVNDQLSAADFWGNVTLNRMPDGNIVFKRRISLGSQDTDAIDDILEGIYSQQQTEHPVWTYKLHVPWKILTANTAAEYIDQKHKTVTWKYDTLQMWNKYEIMSVEMKKGISWLVIALVVVVAALVVFFAIWLIRISKRSHLKDALQHQKERAEQDK
ncbi:MAG TPA: hypothetical protein PLG20_09855 [Candidatus Syntrophosphaera sp.]|jgi:hypothetical protein|nr:hypothetical protein [Candidatus Syntrophosphaera sp.]